MERCFILVVDGCASEYLSPEIAPNLFQLTSTYGFMKTVQGAVPTVTNVNHACILSGKFPQVTKVVGNYYYNPQTGEEGFIEEKGFMKAVSILQIYKGYGLKTALLTVKGKVLGVYGEGVDIGISIQTPDMAQLKNMGLNLPPKVNDLSATKWILNAALCCIEKEKPDILYCTTNDYCFHHYAPDTPEAEQQIRWIDHYVAQIHQADPERQIYITADHGMNQKHTLLNFETIAKNQGIEVYGLAPLKDRYIENHIYQEGGILYLFLKDKNQRQKLLNMVDSIPQIEQILTSQKAAELFCLPQDQIGDYVIFAAPDCAFGEIAGEYLYTDDVRTHGSLYERTVPLLAIHPQKPEECYKYSKDIVANLLEPST